MVGAIAATSGFAVSGETGDASTHGNLASRRLAMEEDAQRSSAAAKRIEGLRTAWLDARTANADGYCDKQDVKDVYAAFMTTVDK